jgi:hypothetical protein
MYTAANIVNTQVTRLLCDALVSAPQVLTAIDPHLTPFDLCSVSIKVL